MQCFKLADHRRKRRKKTYLQQAKIGQGDTDKQSGMIQEVSSDDNSGGNSINQGQEEILLESTADEGLLDCTADTELYSGMISFFTFYLVQIIEILVEN